MYYVILINNKHYTVQGTVSSVVQPWENIPEFKELRKIIKKLFELEIISFVCYLKLLLISPLFLDVAYKSTGCHFNIQAPLFRNVL